MALAVTSAAVAADKLSAVPDGAVKARFGYYPVPLNLVPSKPTNVKKEPTYQTAPKYGIIKLGDGPKSEYVVALDQPENGDWKIYIDKNQNGDLTDDGDGSWGKKTPGTGRTQYGILQVALRASYGSARRETSSSEYRIALYAFTGRPAPFMYRETTREGTISVGGKTHKAILVENDTNGLFNKRVASAEEATKSRPVWLRIDTKDDGKFVDMVDIRAPFKLGDATFEANVANDGSSLALVPTTKPALDLAPKAVAAPALLKTGSPAPNFTAEKWGGGSLNLADYRGKVVVLDFWATWCGPCQKSMPHIETVAQGVKGQDVVVLGVCVWDDKAAYEEWVPKNQSKYTFQFAFDPAGRDSSKGIASSKFNVSGIPTTYIIDKDGNVAAAIVGYQDGDKRVEEALTKLGVKVNSQK